MRSFLIALALLSLTACAPSRGASYIAVQPVDAQALIGPPPPADSPQQAADLAAVRQAQALKGQARWRQAQNDDATSPFTAFAPVLGTGFTRAAAPRTAALFKVLAADAKSLTSPAKRAFGRPRPPRVDRSLDTCRMLELTRSYPSGHATRGWLMALVLAEMVPEKAQAILARGRDYGDSRVVCAQHFPTDVEAGRKIGAAVFASAKMDPDFEADLSAAKSELRAALRLQGRP